LDKSHQTSNPLVSVIISTYNRANLLGRAMNSVLNQSYQNFELLIVDAASIDETRKVVNTFSDSRIKYLKFEERIRKSKAINEAVGVMKGDYLTILDDDDELFPQMLQEEVNALHNTPNNIGFVFGKAKVLRNGKIFTFPRRIYRKKADFYKAQLHSTALSLWGTLIKKACFKNVGLLNEELVLGEDWEFMLRLLKQYDYKYVSSPVYKANYHDSSNISHLSLNLIKNYSERIRSYKIFLNAHLDEIQNSKPILAKFYFRIARNLYNLHKLRSSGKFFRLTLLTKPLNFRPLLWLLILEFTKNSLVRYQLSQRLLNKIENSNFGWFKKIFA
jgi:glycosyltransferase involved in cell wall biosynthesis